MKTEPSPPAVWTQILAGSLLMLATLPGRTHGLGLITEPLLADLSLSRHAYAQINTWATLLGAAACLPVGAWLDRLGLRIGALVLLPALAAVVGLMTLLPAQGGDRVVWALFAFVLLTRALGQSALSVLSLAVAGRAFKQGAGMAAGMYSLLVSVFFAASFVMVGNVVSQSGWRHGWVVIAMGLVCMLPVALWLRGGTDASAAETGTDDDFTLAQCLRIPAFWAYTAGIAAFAAVTSGVSLFNEAVLAERGFDRQTYQQFQGASFMIALLGQIVCGAGMRWLSIRYWLGGALLLQAGGLAAYSHIQTPVHLWSLAAVSGVAAGIIMVAFYAIWSDAFGKRHLGRIQGAAQTGSVVASALGPLLLERGMVWLGGYANALLFAAPVSVLVGLLILFLKPPARKRINPAARQ
ncbi:MAG TPA: MFS transporter [Prosthecobacter sp.]